MEISTLIVGLGNPEEKYKNSPHNAGFEVLSKTATILKAKKFKKYKNSLLSELNVKGDIIVLAKPLTYMNNSGFSVKQLFQKYLIDNKNLIVCYDDLDIPLGSVKLSPKGGSGGHNGIESIIKEIGTSEFKRVRVGVKKEGLKKEDVIEYLLNPLSGWEVEEFFKGIEIASEALKSVIYSGWSKTITNFNKRGEERKEEDG